MRISMAAISQCGRPSGLVDDDNDRENTATLSDYRGMIPASLSQDGVGMRALGGHNTFEAEAVW
jgi:hypothetical protein